MHHKRNRLFLLSSIITTGRVKPPLNNYAMRKLTAEGLKVKEGGKVIAKCQTEDHAKLFALSPELLLLAKTIREQFIDQGMSKDSLRVIMIDQILNKL